MQWAKRCRGVQATSDKAHCARFNIVSCRLIPRPGCLATTFLGQFSIRLCGLAFFRSDRFGLGVQSRPPVRTVPLSWNSRQRN